MTPGNLLKKGIQSRAATVRERFYGEMLTNRTAALRSQLFFQQTACRLLSLGVAALACTMTAVARADEPSNQLPAFQFSREIKAPPLKQEELLAVTLDADVFAATQEGLADVRLLDAEGRVVPYFLRRVQTTRARAVRNTWPARQPTARPLDDGGLEITLQIDEDDKHPHPNGLRIFSPLRNFKQRVRVFTSADGGQWEPAGEETVIFDYSRYMDVRSDSVSFPETARRHFRIVIDDVTVEQESELLALTRRLQGAGEVERTEQVTVDRRPFRIERIDFWRVEHQERVTGNEKAPYPVAAHRVDEDREKHRTIIEVDTRRQPLTSLALETPDRNFSRHAVVEVQKVQGVTHHWQNIGEGTLSRVEFKNVKQEELAIKFPESRHAQYRIVIDNRDSPPLQVVGVAAEGNVYELVYLAGTGRHDRLLYGSADAEQAAYDTAAVEELLRKGFQPSPAELGVQLPNQGDGATEFHWPKILNNPLMLGGVITLLTIVLGWGLYRAVQRIDKLPNE